MGDREKYQFQRRKGTGGIKGQLNEVKLLMLFLAEGLEAKARGLIDRFYLGSNVEPAMDFDDVVFKYVKGDACKVLFLQAKHRENVENKAIDATDMSIGGDFSLRRYLNSYLEAKKNFAKSTFDDPVLKNVIDCSEFLFFTNVGIKKNDKLKLRQLNGREFLIFSSEERESNEKQPEESAINTFKSCKIDFDFFDMKVIEELKKPIDFLNLVNALIETYEKKALYVTSEICKKYVYFLENHVVHKTSGSCTFRKEFLDGSSKNGASGLRDAFIEALSKKYKKITKESLLIELSHMKMNITKKENARDASEVKHDLFDIPLKEIKDFFHKFRISVNQPNEEELEVIIKNKIRLRFKQLSEGECTHIYNYVSEKILAWWRNAKKCENIKKEKSENNIEKIDYITEEDDYFQEAKNNLSSLVFASNLNHTLASSKVGEIGLVFLSDSYEELRHLIDGADRIGIVTRNEETKILHYVKLRQALNDSKYMSEPYYYYIVSSLGIECILESFRMFFNLLILELKPGMEIPSEQCKKLESILLNKNKKIILLGEENVLKSVDIKIKIWNDEKLDFDYLEQVSQEKFLKNTQIIFRGQLVPFIEVFPSSWTDHTQLIDADTMSRILNRESYSVGSEPKGPCQDHFIERTLERRVRINKNCFYDTRFCIAVSGMSPDQVDLQRREAQRTEECVLHVDDEDVFDQLIPKDDCSLHWLKYDKDSYSWVRSASDIVHLRSYLDMDHVEDVKPEHVNENIVLIAAEPGMGKSTLLSSLAARGERSQWRIMINLNEYCSLFQKWSAQSTEIDKDKGLNFLADSMNLDSFGKKLFRSHYNKRANISVFLDGFDEICPSHGDTVVNLLRALVKSKTLRIWISTRIYTAEELENKLCIFAYRLKPFSEDDQRNFLKTFWKSQWKSSLSLKDIKEERVDDFIKHLLLYFSQAVDDNIRQFVGIPLQLQMLGENYKRHFEVYVLGDDPWNNSVLGHADFNIFNLYESFVKNKFNVWKAEKLSQKIENEAEKIAFKDVYAHFEIDHSEIAFFALFNENQLRMDERKHNIIKKNILSRLGKTRARGLFTSDEMVKIKKKIEDIGNGREKRGFINSIIDGKPQFVHRTFAEFFVSKWLVDNLKQRFHIIRKFMKNVETFHQSNSISRTFFDLYLSNDVPLLKSALVNNVKKIDEIQDLAAFQSTDAFGRSALYLAAFYGNVEAVKSILKKYKDNIDYIDQFDRWEPIYSAMSFQHCFVVEQLLLSGAMRVFNVNIDTGKEILRWALRKGYVQMARIALKACPKDFISEMNYVMELETPLYTAITHQQSDAVSFLLSQGANPFQRCEAKYGNTPLHVCSKIDNNIIFLHLIKAMKGASVDLLNHSHKTPLHVAVEHGHYNMVKRLLKCGANTEVVSVYKTTPLHIAAKHGFSTIMEMLLRSGADKEAISTHKTTALHIAAEEGHGDTVEVLLDYGADIEAECLYKQTPLHVAAARGQDDVIELLKSRGASTDARDENDNTPAEIAASRGMWKTACLLGGDDGLLLFGMIVGDDWDAVKWLLLMKPMLVHGFIRDETPLHTAARLGRKLIAMHLLETQTVHSVVYNSEGISPLHLASRHGQFEMVKLLQSHFVHPTYCDSSGWTALHEVAKMGKMKIFRHFLEGSRRPWWINTRDQNGSTLLHAAIDGGQYDMVDLLLEHGADCCLTDSLGCPPSLTLTLRASSSLISIDRCKGLLAKLEHHQRIPVSELHVAAAFGNEPGMMRLIRWFVEELGINVDVGKNNGATPLLFAIAFGRQEVVKYLIERGADRQMESLLSDDCRLLVEEFQIINKKYSHGEYDHVNYAKLILPVFIRISASIERQLAQKKLTPQCQREGEDDV